MNRNWKISQYCENPPRYNLCLFEDACASYQDGDVCVMALCDGAETATLSSIGASCIAEFSAAYFAEHFDAVYSAEFNTACEELIKYHQAMISRLAEVALEKKGVQILIDRTIQMRELNKFASSVQILAVKGDEAIYFKVGNGSAVIASEGAAFTLSDSVMRDPAIYVTTPNPVNLLISCDFKTFTLSPSCYAIALATDGAEFENGLFYDHSATPFYEKVLEDIADCTGDAETELQAIVNALVSDNMNCLKDNIGISVMYRERLVEEIVETPVVEAIEEAVIEEAIEEEPEAEIVEEAIEDEPEVEIVEEVIEDEIEVEIVEEVIEDEIEVEIVEEAIEEEIEIVEEAIEDEIEVEIVEEVIEEEPEAEIVEEAIEEEPEAEIVEEVIEEEPEVEIVEEAIEDEIEVEIVEEVIEDEPEVEIVEEVIEDEIEAEIVEEVIEDEIEVEIVEEAIEDEIEVEIVEEATEDEIEAEIVEEVIEEEPEAEIVEEVIEEEPEVAIVEDSNGEEVAIEIVDDEEDEEPEQEKKISKSFFKLFSVSIKKK